MSGTNFAFQTIQVHRLDKGDISAECARVDFVLLVRVLVNTDHGELLVSGLIEANRAKVDLERSHFGYKAQHGIDLLARKLIKLGN